MEQYSTRTKKSPSGSDAMMIQSVKIKFRRKQKKKKEEENRGRRKKTSYTTMTDYSHPNYLKHKKQKNGGAVKLI